MKVYEFAKENNIETIALMDKIKAWGLPVKSHMSTLDEDLIDAIQKNLKEEIAVATGAVEKKTVRKKTVAKKTAAKKKTAAQKVAAPIKRVTTVKSVVEEGEKKTAKKTSSRKKSVIRRKASHTPEALEKAKEEAALAAVEEEKAKTQQEAFSQEEGVVSSSNSENSSEVTGAVQGEAGAAVQRKPRGNIIGRMDLSRVKDMSRDSSASADKSSMSRGTAAGTRNLRTGFVAAPISLLDDHAARFDENEKREKEAEENRKKKAGAGKEQPVQNFKAADFRKREVIFQAKKKRPVIGVNKKTELTTPKAHKRVVKMEAKISVNELANQMNIKAPQLIKKLISEGVMANMNTELDYDTVSLLVGEFGFEVQTIHKSEDELLREAAFGDIDAEQVSRPPVVTVMGHVDHGKTTLLDSIRNADVAAGEAGGITQHIGAYNVTLKDGKVTTFIDTPGHAAFTAMRARGAHVTDIAVIVVAADDGMMPQTEEAVSHAQAAGVPIIVAVNKMDRPNANPEKIKQQLSEKGLLPEDWGGETIYCPVSALKREGIEELLEQIHTVAEVQELKANPHRSGTGIVIESKMERGKGNVATILVQDGSVKVGDAFVAGLVTGRVRRMTNDKGEIVHQVGPGTPVEITGMDNTPQAGDRFDICKDEASAREVSQLRESQIAMDETPHSGMSLDVLFSKVKSGDVKELPIVLKADVAGSTEAIRGMFDKISTDEVKVKLIHSAVGGISENDVLLAGTAGGIVIGFNVRPDATAQRVAKEKGVEIKTYSVIYHLSDDIKKAMSGLLSPDIVEEAQGSAEVRETFTVPKVGLIAGCFVTDGKISRSSRLRLVREGKVIYEGNVSSLKRFKDDAKEVQSGYECGIGIENYNDIKVGDVIEAFTTKEVARELE